LNKRVSGGTALVASLLLLCWLSSAGAAQPLQRFEIQSDQGLSKAVRVSQRSLLHTSQLFPYSPDEAVDTGDLDAQFNVLMKNLTRVLEHAGTTRDHVVKLNVYVSGTEVAQFIRTRLGEWFANESLPAVSYVQTQLPYEEAAMALDAVVAIEPWTNTLPAHYRIDGLDARPFQSSYCVMPLGDVVYVAGQAQTGTLATATADTLKGLLRTLEHLKLGREYIAEIKCFLDPMTEIELVDEQIAAFFGDAPVPPVSHVEWIAGSLPIEIELVAYAPAEKSSDTIEIATPPWMTPSPVFSRITRLFGNDRIYLSGLYSREEGDGESQVRDIFASMRTTLAATGSDFRHLAKATYYVSADDSSAKLNEVRPTIYDPARPPSASKAKVKGVGVEGRSISIDMIAAPAPAVDLPAFEVATKIVEDSSTGDFKKFRKMITGPGANEHPPYKGCTGFVGWESVSRLRSGELLCSFSAGYWHVSFPSPIDVEPNTLKSYQANGFPLKVDAPTGGRALIARSKDNGKTWSQPTTLVDTPGDDRHPVIVEHPDGTLVCVFFVIDNWYGYNEPPPGRNKNSRVASIRSTDGGKTWTEPIYMPSPFEYYDRMCGKPVILANGEILLSTYGKEHWHAAEQLGVYQSSDSGKTWHFVSRLEGSIGALDEPAITKAKNGQIVMVARPNGETSFSSDNGHRWTSPRPFGINMVAPCLMTLADGTIVCIFGWGGTGGLQIMWSDDHGRTWTVPGKDRGFSIDNSVYVYGIGTEMPDGSIYVVYYDPAGKQRKTAIWGLRLRIKQDRTGIEFLSID
jgi:enamine deaminase RidA (YjgF/YER057c/UK114 family)